MWVISMAEDKQYEIIFTNKGSKNGPSHITSGGKGRYAGELFVDGLADRSISGSIYLGKGFQPINLSKVKVIVVIPE